MCSLCFSRERAIRARRVTARDGRDKRSHGSSCESPPRALHELSHADAAWRVAQCLKHPASRARAARRATRRGDHFAGRAGMHTRIFIRACLSALLLAEAAMTESRTNTLERPSTYTPGPAGGSETGHFSQRGSAILRPPASRGGGPRGPFHRVPERAPSPATRAAARGSRARWHIQSDNQTRRPGGANYTGASFGPQRGAHRTASPRGLSLADGNYRARTGSATRGPIPLRAPSSNEAHFARSARGGGPGCTQTDAERAAAAAALAGSSTLE